MTSVLHALVSFCNKLAKYIYSANNYQVANKMSLSCLGLRRQCRLLERYGGMACKEATNGQSGGMVREKAQGKAFEEVTS